MQESMQETEPLCNESNQTDTSIDDQSSQILQANSNLMNSVEQRLPQSPIKAMNTIGLPTFSTSELNESLDRSNSIAGEENDPLLILDRNEEYISTPVEVSTHQRNDTQEFAFPIRKVKSLNNIPPNDDFPISSLESQTRSISCTNICLLGMGGVMNGCNGISNAVNESYESSSSPVLFSPSLCDINDMAQMPILSPQVKPSSSNGIVHSFQNRRIHLESTPLGSENSLYFGPSALRNFTSSPTNESDINYQNSELSIRSHELYAPQPDSDLNLTLTGDSSQFFPYQPSEISDFDLDDDFCGNLRSRAEERLLGTGGNTAGRRTAIAPTESDIENDDNEDILNDSQSSIDELYQQITRRPSGKSLTKPNNSPPKTDLEEEDSSQCSVISFVEPAAENQ